MTIKNEYERRILQLRVKGLGYEDYHQELNQLRLDFISEFDEATLYEQAFAAELLGSLSMIQAVRCLEHMLRKSLQK